MPQIIPIADSADPRIDAYRDIRERDLVGRQGLFVAEGEVVLRMLLRAAHHRPLSLLLAEKRLDALASLLAKLPDAVPVYAAAQEVLDGIAGFALHRGILAIGRRADPVSPGALLAGLRPPAIAVALVGIANHDNMGGIFRNAAAFGAGAVILDSDCCDPLYRKAIRVSVGAALTVPFARLQRGEDLIGLLRGHGFEPFALSPSGTFDLDEAPRHSRVAALFGAEGPGLPPGLLAGCRTLRIRMADGVDSLNVATTSGIVLHHFAMRPPA